MSVDLHGHSMSRSEQFLHEFDDLATRFDVDRFALVMADGAGVHMTFRPELGETAEAVAEWAHEILCDVVADAPLLNRAQRRARRG